MWIPRPLTWILWHVAPLGQDPPWPPAPLQTRAQLVGVEEPEVCGPCLDQNRRDIGKSQSKWTDSKMETPAHRDRGAQLAMLVEHRAVHRRAR
jgi:hypothetical protein